MNKLINSVKTGKWNQDSIARDILNYLSLNIGLEDVNFGRVLSVIKHPTDLQKFKDSCKEYEGLFYNTEFFVNDCIQVRTPITVEGLFIEDLIYKHGKFIEVYDNVVKTLNQYVGRREKVLRFLYRAHRDAIQLIPANRYVGGGLVGVTIRNNVIMSDGSLQPIFSSDGWYEDLTITGNVIDTLSDHLITIGGVLSGNFEGNTDSTGKPVIPTCYPLRFGGGKLNYHVMSLIGDHIYRDIPGVTGTKYDLRRVPRRGVNIYGLNLVEFRKEYAKLDTSLTRFDRVEMVIADMKSDGRVTTKVL